MKAINRLFFLALLFFSITVHAFQPPPGALKGTVTDENNAPLTGVTIMVKGSQKVSTTDAEGKYSISVDGPGAILQISYVGYTTKEVKVGKEKSINVTLQSISKQLSDVVVIGYGTSSKRDVTGSITTVKSEEFNPGVAYHTRRAITGKSGWPERNQERRSQCCSRCRVKGAFHYPHDRGSHGTFLRH